MEKYFGADTPKLGFGLMRLPKLSDGKTIDVEEVKKLVDEFMAKGFTYFDTAFVYDGGDSEKAAKAALVDRYPRDKYTIATKLNVRVCKTQEEAIAEFDTSLERLGCGYIDYYLVHAVDDSNYDLYTEWGIWDLVKEKKAAGLVKHIGFSFHGTPECLEKVLTEHPEAEFVQLQINYADWNDKIIASGRNYEVARKFGKSIVVMEPVKGGALANPPQEVKDVFDAYNKDASYASWAIRFVASHDGILTVLSGMSTFEQVKDNTTFMQNFQPLSPEEEKVVQDATDAIAKVKQIKCTGCHYCTDGCPMNIRIPEVFNAMNYNYIWHDAWKAGMEYRGAVKGAGKPYDCIECGQCEGACPQGIEIIDNLKAAVEMFPRPDK